MKIEHGGELSRCAEGALVTLMRQEVLPNRSIVEGRQTSRRANRDEGRALSPLQSGRSAERLALQSFTGALNRLPVALVPRPCARSER